MSSLSGTAGMAVWAAAGGERVGRMGARSGGGRLPTRNPRRGHHATPALLVTYVPLSRETDDSVPLGYPREDSVSPRSSPGHSRNRGTTACSARSQSRTARTTRTYLPFPFQAIQPDVEDNWLEPAS